MEAIMIGFAVGVAVGIAVVIAVVAAVVATSPIICFMSLMKSRIKEMNKEPKLPYKLKWGDRTAARVSQVEYLIDVRLVGYTSLKDVIIVEVHESVTDEVSAWSLPPEDLKSVGSGDVFMKKPRAGAYYRYIKIKDIVHEES